MEAGYMTDDNDFEVDIINDEDNSTSRVMTSSSGKICSIGSLDTFLDDAWDKKRILISTMDSVKNLMKEVEFEEKAAEEAKAEAYVTCSYIMAKVNGNKQALQHAEEKNNKLAKRVTAEKDDLAAKIQAFQLRVMQMLEDGERALALLKEMRETLKMRLVSAKKQKEIANKQKQLSEEFISIDHEMHMEKAVAEFRRLEQEEFEISKLQELLIGRGDEVDRLHGEIYDKCQDVLLLKEEFDKAIQPGGLLSSDPTLSNDLYNSSFEENENEKNSLFSEDIKEEEQTIDLQSSSKSLCNSIADFEADMNTPAFSDHGTDVGTDEGSASIKEKRVMSSEGSASIKATFVNKPTEDETRAKGASADQWNDEIADVALATCLILIMIFLLWFSWKLGC